MRCLFVLVVAVCGCNQIYGLDPTKLRPEIGDQVDLDDDGIADTEDLCIAAPSDEAADSDADGDPNATDPCPFDGVSPDPDQDLLGACDPFPSIAGDRTRCVMAFQNVDLNTSLWLSRTTPWILVGGLEPPDGTSTLVASTSLEAPTATTYDAFIGIGVISVPVPASTSFAIFVRTGATESEHVGCRLERTSTAVTLSVVGGKTTSTATINARLLRLRAIVEAGATGPNLRCELIASDGGGGKATAGPLQETVAFPSGFVGFGALTTGVAGGMVNYRVHGLAIHDRISAPSFP